MSNLISFRGGLGAGKSTAAQYLVKAHGFTKIAFADSLKLEVFDAFWTGDHEGLKLFLEYSRELDSAMLHLRSDADFPGQDLYYILPEQKIDWINQRKVALRPLLQWFGTEYRRNQNENYWVNQWHDRTVDVLSNGGRVVVDDARFDNEIDLILSLGGRHLFIAADPMTRAERLQERDGSANFGIQGHASERLVNLSDPRNFKVLNNDCSQDMFYQQIDEAL